MGISTACRTLLDGNADIVSKAVQKRVCARHIERHQVSRYRKHTRQTRHEHGDKGGEDNGEYDRKELLSVVHPVDMGTLDNALVDAVHDVRIHQNGGTEAQPNAVENQVPPSIARIADQLQISGTFKAPANQNLGQSSLDELRIHEGVYERRNDGGRHNDELKELVPQKFLIDIIGENEVERVGNKKVYPPHLQGVFNRIANHAVRFKVLPNGYEVLEADPRSLCRYCVYLLKGNHEIVHVQIDVEDTKGNKGQNENGKNKQILLHRLFIQLVFLFYILFSHCK